ncbi:tetratricopeptide repeat protein [Dactylosporangium sp. NPDC005555]|uniref:tetratricopeptide repeat protein n=1 Tax=Dactylosporangium sp. NPDC005555 TaxID=3154889 RepID=UPI0033B92073
MGDGGFGELLGAGRRAAGISQRELADRARVSVGTIRDLEQGRTRLPRQALVDAVVAALQLTGDAEAELRRAGGRGPATAARQAAADQPPRVEILGPLRVHRGQTPVPVGRGRRRAVLARLALSANDVVPVSELVDLVWDDGLPPVPAHAMQTYLSRLRSALRPAGPERAVSGDGYRLSLGDGQLDLADFRSRVRLAKEATDPAAALDLLDAALMLWRGDPLQDVPELSAHPLVAALAEERIAAVLRLADLAIAVGRPDRCLPQLRALAAAHPLHEPVHARLIAALAAGNLQAAALDTYTGIRRRLVEDLGIEPSPDLVDAHRRVLRQEHTTAAEPDRRPAQLPADVRRFSGRASSLALLDGLLDAHDRTPSVTMVVLSGTAGVGKTALAVHWAHRVQHRFPDGQLHVNLRGFHAVAAPLSAGEALHGFLLALGLEPHRVPAGQDAQSALLRTLLADRRMLIVLDNARDADDVRPLLPGAHGCFVVITSRHELTGLVATEDAHQVPLDLLSDADARDLLVHRLGAARAAAEPDAVDAIAERCARLPLALAVAAARAGARPEASLADLAADLGDSQARLDALSTGDPGTDVRAVLFCSYRTLRPEAARLFRLVGLHPGGDLSAAGAAALAGSPLPRIRRLLAELTGAHLMAEAPPGRYAFHDLLHAYAAGLAAEEDPEPERRAALDRLFDHQLAALEAATRALFPGDDPPAPPGAGAVDPGAARVWLDAERGNIVALAGHGARHGWAAHTTALAAAARRYLDSGHFADGLVLHSHALEAARRLGDRAAEGAALNHIGATYRRSGQYVEAGEHHSQALAVSRAVGDDAGVARSLSQLGAISWRLGDYQAAQDQHGEALDIYRAIGDQVGEAGQLNMFGIGNRQNGNYDESIVFHTQALELLRGLGHRLGEADALNNLGLCHQQTGDLARAIDCHQWALALFRQIGHQPGEAVALNSLGRAHLRAGRAAVAVEHQRRALVVCREIGEHSFEAEVLNGLGAAQLADGEPRSARDTYAAALALAVRNGDRHEQAAAHEGLAGIHLAGGDTGGAVGHWRQAAGIYTALDLPDALRVADELRKHAPDS